MPERNSLIFALFIHTSWSTVSSTEFLNIISHHCLPCRLCHKRNSLILAFIYLSQCRACGHRGALGLRAACLADPASRRGAGCAMPPPHDTEAPLALGTRPIPDPADLSRARWMVTGHRGILGASAGEVAMGKKSIGDDWLQLRIFFFRNRRIRSWCWTFRNFPQRMKLSKMDL